MEDKVELLNAVEYELVSKALFEILCKANAIPSGVKPQYQSLKEAESIGLFSLPGAKYTRRWIGGGFKAQLPFQIAYICKPTNNAQRLAKQEVVDSIADYLTTTIYPELSDNRKITEITVNSSTYVSNADTSGNVTFVRTGILHYKKKGVIS